MNQHQERVLEIAHSFNGTPYKYGAKPEEIPTVFDCSSFTQEVYRGVGIEIPRSTILQAAQAGKEIQLTANFEPGDLLFFRGSKGHYNDELFPNRQIYIGHVAIYEGDGKAIHASSPQGVIKEDVSVIINIRGPIVLVKRIL
jgi:cell wall-associated NlpC family hydrolase